MKEQKWYTIFMINKQEVEIHEETYKYISKLLMDKDIPPFIQVSDMDELETVATKHIVNIKLSRD